MAGTMSDDEALSLMPAVEEFERAVSARDELTVAACFHHTAPTAIAVLAAERSVWAQAEWRTARETVARQQTEIRSLARQLEDARGTYARLDAELFELRAAVHGPGLASSVNPVGMTLTRAQEIAAEVAERKSRDSRS